MENPEISVLMSVYNGEATVGEAIESILAQTFENLEFVIVEDGSTDSTSEVLAEFEKKDARIRVIRQANSGLTEALNRGLAECRAPLVARQDADDRSLPERLVRQVEFMAAHPDVVMLGTAAHLLGRSRERYSTSVNPEDDAAIRKLMQKRNAFFHTSVVFRRSVAEELGGYDTAFIRSQDFEFWLRLLDAGCGGNLPELLVELNMGPQRVSRTQTRAQVTASIRAKLKNRHGSVLKDAPLHLFWWNLRGFLFPPGTLDAIRARWS